MATIKLPIPEASEQQIRDFCELQQLDVSSARSRGDLLAVLGPAWEHDYILITAPEKREDDEAAAHAQQTQAVAAPAPGRMAGGVGANDPIVKVRVGNTSYAGGKDPVPVGVNGRTIVVQRNQDVNLPYRFYLALQNAIRQEIDQDQTVARGEITATDITNYPISVLSGPSDEEIRAWHERTDNELMPA